MKLGKVVCGCLLGGLFDVAVAGEVPVPSPQVLERGHYLVATAGCNDCHTPGYPEADGMVPVDEWLTGAKVGFLGPWGTTYPSNLRLSVQALSEEEWLVRARQPMRPPMPWFSLRDMSDGDLKALYQFVRSLGPAGEPAPPYAPPGRMVSTPYIDFVPKNLPQQANAK